LKLESLPIQPQDGHVIRSLRPTLVNGSNERLIEYSGQITMPRSILDHWSATYPNELPSDNHLLRSFGIDETGRGPIKPHSEKMLYLVPYCPRCGVLRSEGVAAEVSDAEIEAKIWTGGCEYSITKTIKQLGMEAQDRAQ
jgi:hypothetical protein